VLAFTIMALDELHHKNSIVTTCGPSS